jgi:hypothetical protein
VPPIGIAATRSGADLPTQASELLSPTLDGSASSDIRKARFVCCNVNSGTAHRWPEEAETGLAMCPFGYLTPSHATAPATIGPVRTIELPGVFEQSAALLMPSAVADVATPFDDGDFVRHSGRAPPVAAAADPRARRGWNGQAAVILVAPTLVAVPELSTKDEELLRRDQGIAELHQADSRDSTTWRNQRCVPQPGYPCHPRRIADRLIAARAASCPAERSPPTPPAGWTPEGWACS